MCKPQDQGDSKLNENCELNVNFYHDHFYYPYKETKILYAHEFEVDI